MARIIEPSESQANTPVYEGSWLGNLINDEQRKMLAAWMVEVNNKLKLSTYAGAIGGRFTYTFTPTSIGTVIKVTDCMTKMEIDLTNYSEW